MFVDIFSALKSIISSKRSTRIDNYVFKLHYRCTGLILVSFCILITAFQYIGDPIDCIGTTDSIVSTRQKVVDEFCWLQNTFILPHALENAVGTEVIAPGVDRAKKGDDRIYQSYYQWVCFVLFIQAVCFYVPHYIWKMWEHGVMKGLINPDLQSLTVSEENREKGLHILAKYHNTYYNHHRFYFIKFVICEVMNLVNVIFQIIITDRFLGGEFSTYGFDVINFLGTDQSSRVDPMVKVFPKLTKCNFFVYGTGAEIRVQDVVCILPVNIMNEKIYVFLWFWFILLAIVTSVQFCYRICTLFLPRLRYMILSTRARKMPFGYLDSLLNHGNIGDWFFLCQLSKNMEEYTFRQFIKHLAEHDFYPESKKLNDVDNLP